MGLAKFFETNTSGWNLLTKYVDILPFGGKRLLFTFFHPILNLNINIGKLRESEGRKALGLKC